MHLPTFKTSTVVGMVACTTASAMQAPIMAQAPLQHIPNPVKVPVLLGVMSRCPDAMACESVFNNVVPQVAGKIDLSLIFIGKINYTEPDFGVTCMHGPLECAGNVQELCAMKYTPMNQWWQFVHCQNTQGRDKIGTPETALQCAEKSGIEWKTSGVGTCAGLDGSGKAEEGAKLLQESVQHAVELGIKKSCTVVINGIQVCVRDGTWKDCEGGHRPEDFIRQIEEEYRRLNG